MSERFSDILKFPQKQELSRLGEKLLRFQSSAGMARAVAGFLIVAGSLQAYSMYVNSIPIFATSMAYPLMLLGYAVIILTFVGVSVVAFGLRQLLVEVRSGSTPTMMFVIAQVLGDRQYKRIMIAVTLLYGAFFAVVSGIIVYRPMENFAQEYLAQIPSSVIAVCCGGVGLVPSLTVYLTDHLGLLIIPANILILVVMSALVGLNATLVVCEYHHRPRSASVRWLLGLGAFTGLFTACPTCAGLFFSAIILGVGSSAVAILPTTQLYFIIGTILLLIGGAFLSTRILAATMVGRCKLSGTEPPS